MSSTQSTENHRAIILARIAKAWDKSPGLTLGELLAASVDDAAIGLIKDETLVEAIERFVLLGPSSGQTP